MRKRILILGLMAALTVAFSAPSFALRAIQGTVGEVSVSDGAALGPVGFRIWSALPGGTTLVINNNTASCRNLRCIRSYITNATLSPGGYIGNQENTSAYNSDAQDTAFYELVDADMGAGTGNHILYYAVAGTTTNNGGIGGFLAAGCTGTQANNCFVRLDNANGAPDLTGTPGGFGGSHTIRHIGGLNPVPNVQVTTGGSCPSGMACLHWNDPPAGPLRGSPFAAAPASPILGVNLWKNERPLCDAPSGDDPGWTLVGQHALGDNTVQDPLSAGTGCRFYGLSVRMIGPASAGEVEPGTIAGQRTVGTNSQPVSESATAVRIVNFSANYAGHGVVNVGWKSGIEGDVQGYYVTRGLSANGPYTRVSDLIAVKGDGSTYMDSDHVAAAHASKTLYYRLDIVQRDGGVLNSSSAAVTLSGRTKKSGPSIR